MSMFVCINEDEEKVKYVLSNSINKVSNYLKNAGFVITEMPSYLAFTIKNYVTLK